MPVKSDDLDLDLDLDLGARGRGTAHGPRFNVRKLNGLSGKTAPQGDIRDQIIVGFDDKLGGLGVAAAHARIDVALARLGELPATVLTRFVAAGSDQEAFFAIAVIRLDDPKLTLPELRKLEGKGGFADIAWFERNAAIVMDGFNDTFFDQQWALARMEATGPWTVPPSGGRTPGGRIILAVIDSGLFPDGVDRDGHGTLPAGTIATLSDDNKGIASAVPCDWGISLLPVKFFGPGASPDVARAAIAIAHAVDKDAKVINASWHVALGDHDRKVLKQAFKYARNKGRLLVVAAGNDGTDNEEYPTCPANYGSDSLFRRLAVLTVAATARHLVGQTPRYPECSGTSAAAAVASAGAALVFALNPGWKPRDVIGHLTASADTVAGLKLACVGGKRLNLRRAVYGPLRITAPVQGDTLPVGVRFPVAWKNEYDNPSFRKVKVEFSRDDGATYAVLTASASNDGLAKWRPAVGQVTTKGRIRITPTRGNFPVVSGRFTVA